MPPKGDPFNFDDVYRQVGAEGFLKKSMADQKSKPQGSPSQQLAARAAAEGESGTVSIGIAATAPVHASHAGCQLTRPLLCVHACL